MGTSSSSSGPRGGTPLVPSWLPGGAGPPNGRSPLQGPDGGPGTAPTLGAVPLPSAIPAGGAPRPLPPPPPIPDRFRAPRANFSRFASSGGRDRASLGRAVAGYVSTASGGARQAARRMGSSRRAGAGLLGFLSQAQVRGVTEALRSVHLEAFAGRPIEEIFLALIDIFCPDGGTIDEGV